jgi:hypothetical protein
MDVLLLKYFFFSAVSAFLASGLLTLALREWISTRIKSSIQNDYDRKLETHKAQLKSEQELAILNIKMALAREAAFHAAAHASFAEGQKATIERKLSSADRLWSSVVQFKAGLPQALTVIDVMTVDEYSAIKDHPSFQQLAGGLSKDKLEKLTPAGIEEIRPYVGEYTWALFSCYQALLIRISLLFELARSDPQKIEWHKDGGNRNLLKAVLTPTELEEFDGTVFGKISWLQRRLESKLLAAAQKVICGEAFGTESLEQAWLIQQRIDQLRPHAGGFGAGATGTLS